MPNFMPYCPYCGQTLQHGDGDETPPLYCSNCGIGWDSPEDLGRSFACLDEFEASADLDAAEQWMHDHGGHSYQEGPDPLDELDDIPPFIEGDCFA